MSSYTEISDTESSNDYTLDVSCTLSDGSSSASDALLAVTDVSLGGGSYGAKDSIPVELNVSSPGAASTVTLACTNGNQSVDQPKAAAANITAIQTASNNT